MASFYNPNEGTWLIKGKFNNTDLLRNSGVIVRALSGEGTVVVSYSENYFTVYSSGELQDSFVGNPSVNGEGVVLAEGGLAKIANVLFIPRKMSDSEARNAATGTVSI